MKRQILLSAALLGVVSAFAQSPVNHVRPDGARNVKQEKELYLKMDEAGAAQTLKQVVPAQNNNSSQKAAAVSSASASISWALLCGSMNCYGQLVSQTRPLQYNDNVNAVSVIHRKSDSYTATPSSESNAGTIVAEISSDWGLNWDSTCIYANFEAGRYPQGAIYAGPGNNNIANAYVVGSGPTVSNNAFTGNWYASKKLAAPGSALYNTTADATSGAQQFIPFGAPNIANHGWSRYGFSATDDGLVRSLALIEDDPTTLGATRGMAVISGAFNAGTFTWTSDTLIPSFVIDGTGGKQSFSAVQMAWNEAGTVGYAVMTGALNSATGSNRGFQPVVFKTTNSGASWALANGIDFNAPTMTVVLQHIAAVSANPTLAIPAVFGDYDIVVDADDKLHIGTTLMSTFSNHDDSLGFVGSFSHPDGESYNWGHVPGNRPYFYDFIGDGSTAWNVVFIDSMSSEGPSSNPAGSGYNSNPWDPTGTGSAKIEVDGRIQLGRTPDGEHLVFSWVESDTNFTSSAFKWNNLPDIKARLMTVGSGTNMYQISETEHNVTQYPASFGPANPEVITRATLHYMSPTTSTAAVLTCTNGARMVSLKVPFTITNSNPYSQLTNNTTWVTAAELQFDYGDITPCFTSVSENKMNVLENSFVFPNPAKNAASVSVEMPDNASMNVSLFNIVGQEVKSVSVDAKKGTNVVALDLNGLTSGVYLVKIKSGNLSSTKKLIID